MEKSGQIRLCTEQQSHNNSNKMRMIIGRQLFLYNKSKNFLQSIFAVFLIRYLSLMGVVAKYICTKHLTTDCHQNAITELSAQIERIYCSGVRTHDPVASVISMYLLCVVFVVFVMRKKNNTKNNTRPVKNYCYQILAKTIGVPHVCGHKFIEGWVAVTF